MDEDKNDFEIIQRDALEALQELPDGAFDALVADPQVCNEFRYNSIAARRSKAGTPYAKTS